MSWVGTFDGFATLERMLSVVMAKDQTRSWCSEVRLHRPVKTQCRLATLRERRIHEMLDSLGVPRAPARQVKLHVACRGYGWAGHSLILRGLEPFAVLEVDFVLLGRVRLKSKREVFQFSALDWLKSISEGLESDHDHASASSRACPMSASRMATKPEQDPEALEDPERQEEEELEDGTKKKRCTEDLRMIPDFHQTDFSSWTTRSKGKNAHGGINVTIYDTKLGMPPKYRFYKKDEPPNIIPFRITFDRNSDITSLEPTGNFDISFNINKGQVEFLMNAEKWLQQQAFSNSKEWFGRDYDSATVKANCTSCVKTTDKYPPLVKTKFMITGPEYFQTRVVFQSEEDKTITEGRGWTFMSKHWGPHCWNNYEMRACINVGIWIVKPRYGLKLNLSDIFVVERVRRNQLPFTNEECEMFPEMRETN